MPYSWKLFKQVKEFNRGLTEKQHFQYLKQIQFEKRKGTRLPLSQLAKKNILRNEAFGDSKVSRKKIAIIYSTEEVTAKRQAFVQSYWSGMPIEDIPFIINVGIGKHNALKSMLRLAENPCFVVSVPDFDNLNAALPIVKQRLCEIMSNKALNPKAQLQNRIRKRVNDDDVKYEFSEKTLGLPICNSEFNLFVSYHIGNEKNVQVI
jgi:hypothetical protein